MTALTIGIFCRALLYTYVVEYQLATASYKARIDYIKMDHDLQLGLLLIVSLLWIGFGLRWCQTMKERLTEWFQQFFQ
jgi:hypothetical protein